MYRGAETRSLLRRIGLSFSMGLGLFVLGALLQTLLDTNGIRGASAYADDLILGLLAGLLVFAYEQRRYKAMLARIKVIAALNHHIRNALQSVTFLPYAEQSKQIQLVDESAKRIEWALNEILPRTQEEGESALSVGSSPHTSDRSAR
jgi:hypothetical protein